jgi:hypothetical protein
MMISDGMVNYLVNHEKVKDSMELEDLVKMKFIIMRMNGEIRIK